MLAQSVGGDAIQAYCLKPNQQKYRYGYEKCDGWKDGYLGAIDSPPNYGEQHRAEYEKDEWPEACL